MIRPVIYDEMMRERAQRAYDRLESPTPPGRHEWVEEFPTGPIPALGPVPTVPAPGGWSR